MRSTIWVRPLTGTWQAIGANPYSGLWHESLQLVSDQWGPKSGNFTLRRQPRALFPDLLADTPVFVETNGIRTWAGRIKETPESSGVAREIGVTLEGAQYHLDDDAYERVYAHTDMTDWQDARSALTTDLTVYRTLGQVQNDHGIVLSHAAGSTVPASPSNGRVGVFLDLGPSSSAARVVVTYTTSNNNANFEARIAASSTNPTAGTDTLISACNNASGVTGFNVTGRYVLLFLYNGTGTAQTPAADVWIRFSSVQVFADTAYESGNASVLTADTIIKDALVRATTLLSDDLSGIAAPSFHLPDFAPTEPKTPRQYWTDANAALGWRSKIDEFWRPIFNVRADTPIAEIGAWPGTEANNGSSNSAEGVATKVIIRGTGPDGTPISLTGAQTGTVIGRQGGTRTQTLAASYMLNTSLSGQLRDVYLENHRASPYKGDMAIADGGARRLPTGRPMHPSVLLIHTGELIRIGDRNDADTGGISRTAVIDQVTYDDTTEQTAVALDNTRDDFETYQQKLGALLPG